MRAPGQRQHGYILGAGFGFGRVECRLTHLRLRAPLAASKDLARSYAVGCHRSALCPIHLEAPTEGVHLWCAVVEAVAEREQRQCRLHDG